MFNIVDTYTAKLSTKQLEIYYFFLGDLVNKSPFSSPFRLDNKPSCVIHYWNNNYYFKDFGNGEYKHLNWKQFLCKVYDSNNTDECIIKCYESMFKNIQHNTVLGTIHKTEFKPNVYTSTSGIEKIIIEERKWNVSDIKYWNLPKFYLTYHNVIPVSRVAYYKDNTLEQQTNLNHHYRNPTYAYYYGEGKYKIYKPLDKNDNKWRNNIGNIEDVEWDKYSKFILCTSKKDRITLQYCLEKLRVYNIGTISYQSETAIPEIPYKLIGIIPDNDNAGNVYATKIQEKYNTPIYSLDQYKDIHEYFIKNKKGLLKWLEKQLKQILTL